MRFFTVDESTFGEMHINPNHVIAVTAFTYEQGGRERSTIYLSSDFGPHEGVLHSYVDPESLRNRVENALNYARRREHHFSP